MVVPLQMLTKHGGATISRVISVKYDYITECSKFALRLLEVSYFE